MAAAVVINLTMGVNYSWSIFEKALVHDWGWTNVGASLPYTFYTGIYSVIMIVAGRMMDKLGPRRIVTAAGVFMGAGCLLCSLARQPLFLALSYGMLLGVGYAMCYATTIPTTIKWFPPAKRGAVTGITTAAVAAATIYMAPFIQWSTDGFGISRTFLLLALFLVPAVLIPGQFLKTPPRQRQTDPASPLGKEPIVNDYTWKEMLRTANFYRIWLMFFFSAAAGMMVFSHMANIVQIQSGWSQGFYLVSLMAVFNALGRFLCGLLSDQLGRLPTLKITFSLQAVNMFLFSFYDTPALLLAGGGVAAVCYGASVALFPAVNADFFGTRNIGMNYGVLSTAWGLSGLLGPMLAGWAMDARASYAPAYLIIGAALVLSLVLAFFTKANAAREHAEPHIREI